MGDGLVELPAAGQGDAQVALGLGELGLNSQGLPVMGDGLLDLPAAGQDVAQVAVGLGVVGVELQGLAEMGDRIVDPAADDQGVAEIVVGHPANGIPRDRRSIKCLHVGVHLALPPTERSQYSHQQQAQREFRCPPAFPAPPDEPGDFGRHRHDDRQAGQVLKMVGHEGVAEWVDVEKPQRGKQRGAITERGCQGRPACRRQSHSASSTPRADNGNRPCQMPASWIGHRG